jgi:hypothetical protein
MTLLYYGSYSYNYDAGSGLSGSYVFMLLIMLAAAVFQIILFFKIWAMTNDVKKIKKVIGDVSDPIFVFAQKYAMSLAEDKIKATYPNATIRMINQYSHEQVVLNDDGGYDVTIYPSIFEDNKQTSIRVTFDLQFGENYRRKDNWSVNNWQLEERSTSTIV